MTTEYHLKYSSNDSIIRDFLKLIGLHTKSPGVITEQDAKKAKVSFGHLATVSNFIEKDDTLSPEEARKVLDAGKRFGTSSVASLFKNATCPGSSAAAEFILEGSVLRGKNGMSSMREPSFQLNLETQCAQMLPTSLLEGVMFSKDLTPPIVARAALALVGIRNGNIAGSGVVVSEFGDVLTYKGIIGGQDQETKIVIQETGSVRDIEITVTKAHRVSEDVESGIVLLRVPELSGRSWVTLASEQDSYESVLWGMGANLFYTGGYAYLRNLFTPGNYKRGGESTMTPGIAFIGGGGVLSSGALKCIISKVLVDNPNNVMQSSYRGSVCLMIPKGIRGLIGKTIEATR